ncbi:MAG: LarC family nickel insertion protein [Verrucomicrobiota bacterium]
MWGDSPHSVALQTFRSGARTRKIGYGLGHRDLNQRPNVLRARLLEVEESAAESTCHVMECNLDDSTPEQVGVLVSKLLAAGALDAFTTPVQMKKQRPGILLTVLCREDARETLLDLIFRESTTFGVREYRTQRTELPREIKTVETPWGPIRVKVGSWKGEPVSAMPEMEDCIEAAEKHGVSVRSVYDAAKNH